MLQFSPASLRRHRFAQIARTIPRHATILDVGGEPAYWQTVAWRSLEPARIILLNLTAPPVEAPFESVMGDARDLSRYADQSVDVVFSNSVLGHVGTFADQRRMAREIQRVGRRWIVQTPNQWFPLDWHTRVPCFHWLPRGVQASCYRVTRVGSYPRARTWAIAQQRATRIRNVTRRELRELFPAGTLVPERVLGLAKSYTVVGP